MVKQKEFIMFFNTIESDPRVGHKINSYLSQPFPLDRHAHHN